jgi:hypothetical protein
MCPRTYVQTDINFPPKSKKANDKWGWKRNGEDKAVAKPKGVKKQVMYTQAPEVNFSFPKCFGGEEVTHP